jgi:hypothetical protein
MLRQGRLPTNRTNEEHDLESSNALGVHRTKGSEPRENVHWAPTKRRTDEVGMNLTWVPETKGNNKLVKEECAQAKGAHPLASSA